MHTLEIRTLSETEIDAVSGGPHGVIKKEESIGPDSHWGNKFMDGFMKFIGCFMGSKSCPLFIRDRSNSGFHNS